MPHTWTGALNAYRYPVNLACFQDAALYPGWFTHSIQPGDHDSTAAFEAHFRENASTEINAWLEVVFWKLASQHGRATYRTRKVARHFARTSTRATDLYDACLTYINNPSRDGLTNIKGKLGLTSRSIAITATFPAFINPELFPMVDIRIAKWVGTCMEIHNSADPDGPQLIRPPYLDNQTTVLTMSDYDFMIRWGEWCRRMATKLEKVTRNSWRARDVEMAVFYAWGNNGQTHPVYPLNPIALP